MWLKARYNYRFLSITSFTTRLKTYNNSKLLSWYQLWKDPCFYCLYLHILSFYLVSTFSAASVVSTPLHLAIVVHGDTQGRIVQWLAGSFAEVDLLLMLRSSFAERGRIYEEEGGLNSELPSLRMVATRDPVCPAISWRAKRCSHTFLV